MAGTHRSGMDGGLGVAEAVAPGRQWSLTAELKVSLPWGPYQEGVGEVHISLCLGELWCRLWPALVEGSGYLY